MTITSRLDAIREHLDTFDLPEPWSVTVGSSVISRPYVSVQLRGHSLPHVAAVLLAWADTLTDVHAEAWRTVDGGSVHLSITGRLLGDVGVRVFDGVRHDLCFPLELNERRTISLAVLREWTSLDGEVAA
jgi:hypothetical protein